MKRMWILAVTVALGAGVVACGDDDDDESGELSKGQFSSQANEACQTNAGEVDDALKVVNPGVPAGAQSAAAIAEVATLDRELIRRVDDLPAPESEQDEIDQLLDKWRDRAEQEDKVSDAVAAGDDEATIEQLNDELNHIDDDANGIATKLDLDQCMRGGT